MLAARFWTTFLILSFTQVWLVCAQLLNHPAPPHIVSPKSGDTWTVGEVATVRWDLHGIQLTLADGVTPVTGFLVLGQLTDETESGFHLWADQQLASSFLWRDGQVEVVVPKVPSGSNYFLMLERINNQSQLFTIKNPEDPNGTGAMPSSLSISTLASSTTSSSAYQVLRASVFGKHLRDAFLYYTFGLGGFDDTRPYPFYLPAERCRTLDVV
ncbi:hypothetical protein C8Q79DRAFT_1009963 [Trametes meyenii]|nr:hypothetical protein C8Q79DRAFT_1009963 [Trametes meyenii]